MSGFRHPDLNGPLAPVSPEDLRNAWDLFENIKSTEPGVSLGICVSRFEQTCSPGADIVALHFRATLLRHLIETGQFGDSPDVELLLAIAASAPITRLSAGFDPGAFIDTGA